MNIRVIRSDGTVEQVPVEDTVTAHVVTRVVLHKEDVDSSRHFEVGPLSPNSILAKMLSGALERPA